MPPMATIKAGFFWGLGAQTAVIAVAAVSKIPGKLHKKFKEEKDL